MKHKVGVLRIKWYYLASNGSNQEEGFEPRIQLLEFTQDMDEIKKL